MENMADQIKKHCINLTSNTHFIKLNNIFSIFIFIFLLSFSVSLCSYTHHFSTFTDSNDRHYIFLLCNGILVFLFMNFDSTHGSSPKDNQSVITDEINHPPVLVEPVAAMEEQEDEIEEEDGEIGRNGNRVYVIEDYNDVPFTEDHIEDQMAEHQLAVVVDEQETGKSKEAAETEELNKRCEEFISKMRERMKFESSCRLGRHLPAQINATISF